MADDGAGPASVGDSKGPHVADRILRRQPLTPPASLRRGHGEGTTPSRVWLPRYGRLHARAARSKVRLSSSAADQSPMPSLPSILWRIWRIAVAEGATTLEAADMR